MPVTKSSIFSCSLFNIYQSNKHKNTNNAAQYTLTFTRNFYKAALYFWGNNVKKEEVKYLVVDEVVKSNDTANE